VLCHVQLPTQDLPLAARSPGGLSPSAGSESVSQARGSSSRWVRAAATAGPRRQRLGCSTAEQWFSKIPVHLTAVSEGGRTCRRGSSGSSPSSAVTLPRDQFPNQPATTRSCVDYDKQDDTAVVWAVIVAGVISVVLDNRKGHRPAT